MQLRIAVRCAAVFLLLIANSSVAISASGEIVAKLRDRDTEVRVVDAHPRAN